jgi:hypothetical protein
MCLVSRNFISSCTVAKYNLYIATIDCELVRREKKCFWYSNVFKGILLQRLSNNAVWPSIKKHELQSSPKYLVPHLTYTNTELAFRDVLSTAIKPLLWSSIKYKVTSDVPYRSPGYESFLFFHIQLFVWEMSSQIYFSHKINEVVN